MMQNLVVGMVALGLAAASTLGQDESEHARMKLVSEYETLTPGTTNWLGVAFEIDPEWHLYWNGQNDTGFPIKITPTLPEGVKAGPLCWPAPMRHVSPGDLLDHIYEKRVTLLLPVEVPADAKPDSTLVFSVAGEWLVCKSACIAGTGESSLSMKVASSGSDVRKSANKPLFDQARRRVPKPLNAQKPEASVEWKGETIIINVQGAKDLAFFPGTESTLPRDLIKAGEAKGDSLRLTLENAADSDRLVGVLEVNARQSGTEPTVYWIDSRRSGANPAGVQTSDK